MDILDEIENVLYDHEVSSDAMRWTPHTPAEDVKTSHPCHREQPASDITHAMLSSVPLDTTSDATVMRSLHELRVQCDRQGWDPTHVLMHPADVHILRVVCGPAVCQVVPDFEVIRGPSWPSYPTFGSELRVVGFTVLSGSRVRRGSLTAMKYLGRGDA